MKIYTGYGDDGHTQLLGGQRVQKNDLRVSVCGTLDELNAVLGVVASRQIPTVLAPRIQAIQSDLFKFGSTVAAVGAESKMDLPAVTEADCQRLEEEIDDMEGHLIALQNFLLPGGSEAAATMHLARAVCRRAERLLVELASEYHDFDQEILFKYLNRLGDWCFVAARLVNRELGVEEPLWRGTDA